MDPVKSIKVAMLRLSDREPMDLPGLGGKSACTGTSVDKVFVSGKRILHQNLWIITFLPHLRHHRVEYWPHDAKQPVVRYVHESLVKAWEPLTPE